MAVSRRKLAANRQNSGRSTGPRTPEGKRRVRFNALRHGLLAKEVIVPIGDEQEHSAEWERLLNERWQDYTPVGRIENILVEKIAISYWRLRRATRAEVGQLSLEFPRVEEGIGALLARNVARLMEQVEEADPSFDFGAWLKTPRPVYLDHGTSHTALNWDLDEAAAYISGLVAAERKPWLLWALEEVRQEHLEREQREQEAAQPRQEALRASRSLPETVDKILRYETTIERQLYRAIAELEKLRGARRRTFSPGSGPTQAA